MGETAVMVSAVKLAAGNMETGFYSDESQKIFDEIIDNLHLAKEDFFLGKHSYARKIRLNKEQVRSMTILCYDKSVPDLLGLNTGHTIQGQEPTVRAKGRII